MTRSNKARASVYVNKINVEEILTTNVQLTVGIIDGDQKAKVPKHKLNLVPKQVQSFFEYPTSDRFVIGAMIFHEGFKTDKRISLLSQEC